MRDDNIWIFNAGESFAGNPKWYFLYLDKYHKEIKKYWFCYDRKTLHTVRRLGFKSCMFNSLTAKKIGRKAGVYVVDQCKEVFQDYLKGIKILNLWHGVGCKKIEAKITSPLLKERITKKYIKNSSFYQNNQKFLVTSDFMKDHFIKFCNISESQIIKSTYPNSLSFNTPLASKIQKIFSDRNLSYALYAPTYRDNESSCNFFTAIPDINKLIKVLQKTNTRLILKMHPRIAKEANYLKAKAKYSKNKYLCFWDNQYDIYEIMDKIDFAIIDYSSIFYDLMAKGVKKFIRYLYDFEQVYKDTDFEYNPLDYTYGKLCCDFDSLLKAIEESDFEENADEYIAEKKLSIKTKYIYASRKTLRIPAFIEKVDDEFFSEFGNFSVIENYDELIKNSSLTEKEFNSLFPELSYLKNQKYIFTDEQKKLRQFFSNSKEYKSLLLQKAKEERRLICNYLKQEIDFTEKYAFVEYWGRGYTQKSLATLIDFILNKKTPDYTYYARSIYPTQENCIRYNFTANNYSQIPVETLFANIPYKTISSYKTTVDNKIEPVLEENSKCNKALFKAEEKYLVQFTSDFAKLNFFDEDSIFRSLWNFEISYFHNNQNDFYIKNIFSTLVDDISINQNLSSYAPPVTFKDAFFALKGIRLPTKDIKKSIKKSNIIIRIAYKLYKKYKC